MDLQTISSQMKVVIQKHQIVVTEMCNDPQNPVLQKRLNDLQLEIQTLNERQKQVVQDLRKNLEVKQCCPNSCPKNSSGCSTVSHSPSPLIPNQEIRMLCCAQKCPMKNHKLPTTTLATKPVINCVNTVRQTVPPTLNNIATPTATFTFKAPVGTVVLPNCSAANTLKVAEHQKMHPVLVVPSPSNRTVDGTHTGVLFNLVPPIRVPQYPPPLPRTSTPITCQKNQVLNNCIPVAIASVPNTSTPPNNIVEHSVVMAASQSPPTSSAEKHQPPQVTEKITNKIDQKKKEFFSALGLVSKDALSDIKSKRQERKRRSTANPQFSNAALEEKWRNAAAAQASAPPQKRPRGRPRLESKPIILPAIYSANGNCSITDVKLAESSSPIETSSANCTISSSSSPFSDSSAVVNGMHKQNSSADEGKNVEQMLSGLCIVCTQPGDLVKCDTCAKQQHLGCMQPPLNARPQGSWQCSECQSRTVSLIVVQSYDMLKAAKEDEKRKLLKKSLELRLKRSQLESRLHQLRELSGKQKSRQSELQTSLKETETHLEHIHSVINGVRLCS
ncbi:PHD finger protein 21A [Nephila pilipes]|uniref:PHD finger protein 21A n=1 Tax=Nephila pilipes TaxID=299642 RepID=A0A8X6NDB7_NEPPI|nr:PHD finger protein 21A [Nephila pilipes]